MIDTISKLRIVGTILFVLSLSGCVVIEKVRPAGLTITEAEAKAAHVVKVQIDQGEKFLTKEVAETLRQSLKGDLAKCATGDREVVLRIRLDTFVEQSPGGTILLGGQTQLAGLIELRDPKSNKLIAEYYGVEFDISGGLLGLAILANADENLPPRFSRNICETVFLRPLPENAPEQT